MSLGLFSVFGTVRHLARRSFATSYLLNTSLQTSNSKDQSDENRVLDDLYKKIRIELFGHDNQVLKSYLEFLSMTTDHLNIKRRVISEYEQEKMSNSNPRKFYERWTLLKDRFSKRKHMRQYEIRTYTYQFVCFNLTGSTKDTFLEYIQRNLPEGIAMHVHETKLATLPDHILDDISASQPDEENEKTEKN